ncbi:MAG TPA: ABC transporter permease [Acidimicrobiales bacterium]
MTDTAAHDRQSTRDGPPVASAPGATPAQPPKPGGAHVIVRAPGVAEGAPRRARLRRRSLDIGLGVGVPAALLVLWQVAGDAEWIDRTLYPRPTDIVDAGRAMVDDGVLWSNLWVSLQRIVKGFAYGSVAGVVAGFAMGMVRNLRSALEPLLNALYTVPKLALLPVFLTVFGFGERPVVVLIAVTVFFFVWIATMSAVLAVPEGYHETARSLGLNRHQLFRHVLLPAALPEVFVGLRIAAGVSVLMLVGVEFVIGGDGLGYVIEQGRTTLVLGQAYVGIVLVALVGLAFSGVVQVVGRWLTPWSRERRDVPRL